VINLVFLIRKHCIPERATRSVVLRPWAANADLSWSNELKGAGRFWLASDWLAVKPSLLPKGTFQLGPSACQYIHTCINLINHH